MAQKTTIQDRVLLEIYLKGREIKHEDLKTITKLRDHQIYRALDRLRQRGILVHTFEKSEQEIKGIRPHPKLIIKMKNHDFVREYLTRRDLI